MTDCAKTGPEELPALDSEEAYSCDSSRVYKWIADVDRTLGFRLVESASEAGKALKGEGPPAEIVICGMGGSAIAADVALLALDPLLTIPCRVVRSYNPPPSLGKGGFLVVVSYSGNTEESIWAYMQGHNRGARVAAVASGGDLSSFASRHGKPFVKLPADAPAPRFALGYMVCALVGLIGALMPEPPDWGPLIEETRKAIARTTKKYEKAVPGKKNFAKKLAVDLCRVFPVIIGTDLTWPAALRFQTQLNENSKWPAHAARLPEMNHNEIVAYASAGPMTGKIGVIMLSDKDDHPRVRLRQDFTAEMLEGSVAWVRNLRGDGRTPFSRVMSLIQAIDLTSYYLACLRGVDPLDIAPITTLKDRMGKSR